MEIKKVLLHICCAPCATASTEKLLENGYEVHYFYSNSNIHPFEEYKKRLDNVHQLAKHYEIPLYIDEYIHQKWLSAVKGYEAEPERGGRCALCFEYNLKKTFEKKQEESFDHFTTSLTISPYKDSKKIFQIGKNYEGFLAIDFKKQNGYKKSIELSDQLGLYRQKYCGCEFSLS